jgi:hypothetical protein
MANLLYIPASKLIALVREADKGGDMYAQITSDNHLALGDDPIKPRYVIDFASEKLALWSDSRPLMPSCPEPDVPAATTFEYGSRHRLLRRSGKYWIECKGHRTDCGSLKECLAEGLRQIESLRPETLEGLSHVKPRSKCIVARNPSDLFGQSELTEKYAERLSDGWWYGTNNSAQETITWLKRACAIAQLTWQKDFRVSW